MLLHHYRWRYRKGDKIDFGVTSMSDLGLSPSSVIGRKQREQQLLTALRSLPVEHQVLLELFYWEDMGGPELAQMYEVPLGTMRTRLRRARQLLGAALEQLEVGLEQVADDASLDAWAREIRAQLAAR